MWKKKTNPKPSRTALTTAMRRDIAHKEHADKPYGADHLAGHFLPLPVNILLSLKRPRRFLQNKLDAMVPGMTQYLMARTRFFDELFKDAQNKRVPQIVLLGAGYDSRAYRFANSNQGTRIFELDEASTQERKRQCLEKTHISIPDHVTFVPVNFNHESLKDVLEKAGYKDTQKTLFIWEGVSYYLAPQAVETTLAFVRQALDSAIAFDYTVTTSQETIDTYYGARQFADAMTKHHSDERLIFSINDGDITSFLAQQGLKMDDHFDNEKIEKTFLVHENGSSLGKVTGHFRFVIASS